MAEETRLIKKYPNRRLYDTQTSSYITLGDVKQLVLDNESFQVVDAKSGEDLTRSILLQIILDEETCGAPIFTSNMLSHIIRFYGNAMQNIMGPFLEQNFQAITDIQSKFQEQGKGMVDGKQFANPELWAQFMTVQTPMIQSMMSNYIEQSKNMFVSMQDQFQDQTRNLFSNFGFPAQPGKPGASPKDSSKK
ncbi:MAG: polyhydroxyalkanoate synthesis repressor PhaR [Limnobacter sp.]|nr:polyhydroxyalkanoate synthesis repressor PhaR [Limnobacter sp.]